MGGRGNGGNRNNNNTGIPDSRPLKDEVLKTARALKGEALEHAITTLEWDGDWYREDKRQKKAFVIEVVENNYTEDPAEFYDVTDRINSNDKILAAVYGYSSSYSEELIKRFGRYDVDRLYERMNERRRK